MRVPPCRMRGWQAALWGWLARTGGRRSCCAPHQACCLPSCGTAWPAPSEACPSSLLPLPSLPGSRSITRTALGPHKTVVILIPLIYFATSLVVDYVLYWIRGFDAFTDQAGGPRWAWEGGAWVGVPVPCCCDCLLRRPLPPAPASPAGCIEGAAPPPRLQSAARWTQTVRCPALHAVPLAAAPE